MASTSATTFERSTPEAVGISSSAVLNFVNALEEHERPLEAVQGFMLLRHGKVAAEGWWAPYKPQYQHTLYSLSKSFTSTAIGLAVAEGLLTVDDPVLSFFPDDAPAEPGPNLRAMTVKHLLTMNTGHHEDTTGGIFRGADDNWARAFLALPVEHEPGSWFVYNTTATYMLSAIITKLTGQRLLDYLTPRLLEPLGIENAWWEQDPRGIDLGGTGLHIRLEEIARFGQLYLQQGRSNGQQLVPEAWIAEATTAHSDNSNTQTNPDWTVGYGYQFWRCQHGAYRGDGMAGQYCVVLPEQDAVLAINSGLRDMQHVLDLVWEHLLPAMESEALPENPEAATVLQGKVAYLSLPVVGGAASSGVAKQVTGQRYALEDNSLGVQALTLVPGADSDAVVLRNGAGEYTIQAGHGAWLTGTSGLRSREESVAASGAWTAEDTYEMRLCFVEGEVGVVIRLQFDGDVVRVEIEPNVGWTEGIAVEKIAGHAVEGA